MLKTQGVFRDDDLRELLHAELNGVYRALGEAFVLEDISDYAWAARSDVWFASATGDLQLRETALANLRVHAEALLSMEAGRVPDAARRIRGLVEAARILGEDAYAEAAAADFAAMARAFDPATGGFDGVSELGSAEAATSSGRSTPSISSPPRTSSGPRSTRS